MNSPLPIDLRRRWGHLPDIKQRAGREWSSACPVCGGADGARRDPSDRFRMFIGEPGRNSRGFCRQCGYFSWVDEDLPGTKPDPEQIRLATAERIVLLQAENQRIKEKLQRIGDADFWRRWHDEMGEEQIELWRRQGIEPYFQDYYKLGYCPDYQFYYGDEERHSPTMTIPHYGPGWVLTNIQHRLMNPPEPGDKYRQMAGVPAAMFLTEPDEPLTGAVLVVEGSKKAIVTYTNLGDEAGKIVSFPSKTPSSDMLDMLSECEPIYIALDPDAYVGIKGKPPVNRIAERLGKSRVYLVKLPVKPDDFFTQYRGEMRDMLNYIKAASRA